MIIFKKPLYMDTSLKCKIKTSFKIKKNQIKYVIFVTLGDMVIFSSHSIIYFHIINMLRYFVLF